MLYYNSQFESYSRECEYVQYSDSYSSVPASEQTANNNGAVTRAAGVTLPSYLPDLQTIQAAKRRGGHKPIHSRVLEYYNITDLC